MLNMPNNFTDYELNRFKVYHNRSTLTNIFTDYSNVLILPSISLVGIIMNSISIFVSSKLDRSQLMNLFIHVDSVLNFILCLISMFLPVIRCGSLCPYGYTYAAKVYEMYFFSYLKHCILLLSHILQGLMNINRLFAFSNQRSYCSITRRGFKIAIPIILTFSMSIQFVLFLSNRYIKKFGILINENSEIVEFLYRIEQKETNVEFKMFLFIMNLIDSTLLYFVLFIIDMIIIARLRSFNESKQRKMSILPPRSKKVFFLFVFILYLIIF